MKKLDFDVFALISPLSKPVSVEPDVVLSDVRSFHILKLANSIRANRFVLPQKLLLGEQVTRGPSPVRLLQFSRYQVRDFALRKVILSLSDSDIRLIRSYLWNKGEILKIQGRWVELDPVFDEDTERAFGRVFSILEQLQLLEPIFEKAED